jgi:hypothetical protein
LGPGWFEIAPGPGIISGEFTGADFVPVNSQALRTLVRLTPSLIAFSILLPWAEETIHRR